VLDNVLLVTNGKGGVGKTSLVANLTGLAAKAGWSVLAIDLDPQGNLARDLGYLDRSDGGQGLLAAVLLDQELAVIKRVRPLDGAGPGRLDVVAGGPQVARLSDQLGIEVARSGPAGYDRLAEVVAELAPSYDLVVCDLPPGDGAIGRAAMRMGHVVLIPTPPDDAGIDGLGRVFAELTQASSENPGLEVLGVVLTLVVSGASVVEARARADLEQLLGADVTVFSQTVRQAAAVACRGSGRTATEYAQAATEALPWYTAKAAGAPVRRYSSAAAGLAADYRSLAGEVLGALAARLARTVPVASAGPTAPSRQKAVS
jgi:cellulose biosynthesis protein BcsQ